MCQKDMRIKFQSWKEPYIRLRKKKKPRTWNNRINKYFQENNFNNYPHKHALYIKVNKKGDILLVWLFVDDLTLKEYNPIMLDEFKEVMTNIDLMWYCLGIYIT